ncbi:MAG TPA: hypothetical protein VN815_00565 [Steroidobacteraceae bacterium]|jgi:hypothetical protein|nr:hypothetical protein [Steroidobacteraceae bacterium]
MHAQKLIFAAIALSAITAGCGQHTPPPPTSPSLPPAPEMPTKPSDSPLPHNTPSTNPSVPPGSPQPNSQ